MSTLQFFSVTTNPWPDESVESETLRSVLKYAKGSDQFCPFTEFIAKANGYRLAEVSDPPNILNVDSVYANLLEAGLSVPRCKGFDPTTHIVAFTHPETNDATFFVALTAARHRWRLTFVWEGFMLSQMHREHQLIDGEKRFNSEIPLIVIDRVHRPHRKFMTDTAAVAAFSRHFPGK